MKKTSIRIAVSLGISGLLLALVMIFSEQRPADVWRTLRRLPLSAFFTALAMHMSIYVLRAVRFRLLIPREQRPGFGRLLTLSAAHNMASYILPAKTGEASWMVYLKGYCGVRASTGLASLVVARLLDGMVLCSALAVSCLYIGLSHEYDGWEFLGYDSMVFLKLVGGLLVALMVFFGALAARADLLIKLITAATRFLRLHHWSVGEKLLANLYQAALALRDAGRGHRLGLAALITVPVWLGVFGFYAVLGQAVALPDSPQFAELSFTEMIFGSSMAVMANLLPVNGMAGIGTQEGGWVGGFGILGISVAESLPISLVVHAVQLFNVVAMGLIAHVFMGLMRRTEVGPDEDPDEMPDEIQPAGLPPID